MLQEQEQKKKFKKSNYPDLAEEYEGLLKVAYNANQAFEETRKTNLSLYLGDHWTIIDSEEGTVSRIPKVGDEIRVAVNLIRKNLETFISYVLGVPPVFEATPPNESEEDIQKAYTAEKVLNVIWDKYQLIKLLKSGRRIAEILNDSWIETYYDWNKGRIVKELKYTTNDTGAKVMGRKKQLTDKNKNPIFYEKDDKGIVQDKYQKEGDLGFVVRFPDTVFPDPQAYDFSYNRRLITDAKYVYILDYYDIDEIKGNSNYKLPPEDMIDSNEHSSYTMNVILDILGRSEEQETAPNRSNIKVYRRYEFPSAKYPKGRYAVILPNNDWWFLMKKDELPPPYTKEGMGICPLVHFYSYKIEGSIYSHSRLTDVTSLMWEYDRFRSLQLEKLKRNQPINVVNRDAGVDINAIKSSGIGAIVEINASSMNRGVEAFKSFNPPSYSMGEEAQTRMIKGEIEDLMGVHEVQQIPSSRRTLGEVQLIQGADIEQIKNTTALEAEYGYQDLARIILLFVKHYFTEKRTYRMLGERDKLEVIAFKNTDIDYEDVRIQPASSMPMSKYLNQQRLLMMIQQGFFANADANSRLTIMRMLNMKELTPMREEQYDEDNADNENWEIFNNREVTVMKEDNDIIHTKRHTLFKKSPKVQSLLKWKKNKIYKVIDEHNYKHTFNMISKKVEEERLLRLTQQLADMAIANDMLQQPQMAIPPVTPQIQPQTIPEAQPPQENTMNLPPEEASMAV